MGDDDDPVVLPTFKPRVPRPSLALVVFATGLIGTAALVFFTGGGGRLSESGRQRTNAGEARRAAETIEHVEATQRFLDTGTRHRESCPRGTTQQVERVGAATRLSCVDEAGARAGETLLVDSSGHVLERERQAAE